MKLGNIEVEFSFTDADDLEKLERATKNVKEKAENYSKKELSLSESIRKECEIIDEFLDETFGEGTAQKVFKNKKDLQKHMELFEDVMNAKISATKNFQGLYDNLEYKTKYMPNRENRRHNKGRR